MAEETEETTSSSGMPYGAIAGGLLKAITAASMPSLPKYQPNGVAYAAGQSVPAFNEQAAFDAMKQASSAAKGQNEAIGGGIGSALGSTVGAIFGGGVGAGIGGQLGDFLGSGVASLFGDGGAKERMMKEISDQRQYSREASRRSNTLNQKEELDSYAQQEAQRQKAKVKPYSLSNFMEF